MLESGNCGKHRNRARGKVRCPVVPALLEAFPNWLKGTLGKDASSSGGWWRIVFMPYSVPECKITFDPAAGFYGFECRVGGKVPHYEMRVFESLERTLAWLDPHKERVWEDPGDADDTCLLISRAYVPGSVRDRFSRP